MMMMMMMIMMMMMVMMMMFTDVTDTWVASALSLSTLSHHVA